MSSGTGRRGASGAGRRTDDGGSGGQLDVEIEQHWRAFEHRALAALLELGVRGALLVEVEHAVDGLVLGAALRRRPRSVRAVPVVGTLDEPTPRLDTVRATVGGPRVFRVGDELRAVRWLVDLLRDRYGVLHPSFLRVCGPGFDEPPTASVVPGPTARPLGDLRGRSDEGVGTSVGGLGARPTSPDELADLVHRALGVIAPGPVHRDEDGDFVLPGEPTPTYVRVRTDCPAVEVFRAVRPLDDDETTTGAQRSCNRVNLQSVVITFCLVDRWVFARATMPCHPFVPEHLATLVDAVMSAELAREARRSPDAADDAGAVPSPGDADGSDEPDALAPELLTIIQLDAAEPGSVSPELAARIYGFDRDKLLAGIRTSEEQMFEWRGSIAEAAQRDAEEAEVCAGESATWGATAELLRAALRVAVER